MPVIAAARPEHRRATILGLCTGRSGGLDRSGVRYTTGRVTMKAATARFNLAGCRQIRAMATNLRAQGLTATNVWWVLQAERRVAIEVDVIIIYVAGQTKAARILRGYVIEDGAAGPVVTRDEHKIICA
jgi:hypothetical protein